MGKIWERVCVIINQCTKYDVIQIASSLSIHELQRIDGSFTMMEALGLTLMTRRGFYALHGNIYTLKAPRWETPCMDDILERGCNDPTNTLEDRELSSRHTACSTSRRSCTRLFSIIHHIAMKSSMG